MTRRASIVISAFVATLVVAHPAAAAPSWLAPEPLTLPGAPAVLDADIGFGGGRELYATDPQASAPQQIGLYAREPGAGSGTMPALETSFASVTGGGLGGPQLAVAPNGAAVLAWADASTDTGRPLLMRAAYRTPAGAWEQPITVATGITSGAAVPGQLPPFRPHVAIGADGTAVVVAEHGEDARGGELQWDARIDATVHRAGAGGWDGSTRLSAEDRSASSVNVAVAGDGAATVAWADRYGVGSTASEDDDGHTAVARRWVASNGIWDATRDVAHASPADDSSDVTLAVAPDGGALLAYTRRIRGVIATVAARRAPGDGTFGVPRLVATGRVDTTPLAAAVAPDGVATVLWRAPSVTNGADAGVGATRSLPDGSWTAPRLLSGYPEQGSYGAIAFSGADTVLAWSAYGSAEQVVQGTRWQAGAATPDPTRDLDVQSGFVRLQQLVGDGEGGVVALYDRADGLRTAVFDAGAPTLRSAQVPEVIAAQQPATLSADVIDRWSSLAGVPGWEFGDGTPAANGTTITHVFPTPGFKTVTLRAQDALGNTLVRSFTVQVVAPVSGVGGGTGGQGGGKPADRRPAAPRVSFTQPTCPRRLRLARPRAAARRRCARWLGTSAAWRTIRGRASGTTRIELRFTEPVAAGGGGGGRSRRGAKRALTTRTIVRRAAVRRGAWSVRTPALSTTSVTLRLRALDAHGKPTGPAVVKKLSLR